MRQDDLKSKSWSLNFLSCKCFSFCGTGRVVSPSQWSGCHFEMVPHRHLHTLNLSYGFFLLKKLINSARNNVLKVRRSYKLWRFWKVTWTRSSHSVIAIYLKNSLGKHCLWSKTFIQYFYSLISDWWLLYLKRPSSSNLSKFWV